MIPPIEMALARLNDCVAQGLAVEQWDSCRLFHGRGGCYPGFEPVTLDLFAPVLLLTFFKPLEELIETTIIRGVEDLAEGFELEAVQVQRRYLPGAPSECVWGQLPEQNFAKRGSLRFPVQLDGRQNVGFFLDMEPGRHWLEQHADNKKVLNLFAYTCAFSVVAIEAGASQVVNVDMSRSSLAQGRDAHRLNDQDTGKVKFLAENILKSWGRIRRPGPYHVAIIDPPSFQPGSFVAAKDYAKLLRRIPELMVPGGDILVCLNSPELDVSFVRESMARECPGCVFIERLASSEDFPDIDPQRQLKLLHFKYRGDSQ